MASGFVPDHFRDGNIVWDCGAPAEAPPTITLPPSQQQETRPLKFHEKQEALQLIRRGAKSESVRNLALCTLASSICSAVLVAGVDKGVSVDLPLTGPIMSVQDGYVLEFSVDPRDVPHNIGVIVRTAWSPITALQGLGDEGISKMDGNQ